MLHKCLCICSLFNQDKCTCTADEEPFCLAPFYSNERTVGPLTGGRLNNLHIAIEKLPAFLSHNGFIHLNVFHSSVQPPLTLLLLQSFSISILLLCPYCLLHFSTSIFIFILTITSTVHRFITSMHLLRGHHLAPHSFLFSFHPQVAHLQFPLPLCVIIFMHIHSSVLAAHKT